MILKKGHFISHKLNTGGKNEYPDGGAWLSKKRVCQMGKTRTAPSQLLKIPKNAGFLQLFKCYMRKKVLYSTTISHN